jgi:hypothetical protein
MKAKVASGKTVNSAIVVNYRLIIKEEHIFKILFKINFPTNMHYYQLKE